MEVTAMFKRNINKFLISWKNKDNRKPLVIRGARQVGKTSAVNLFARDEFDSYIYINLEQEDNLALFSKTQPIKDVIQIIQIKYNKKIIPGKTLIFIDEIQNSDIAMGQLRYFYEEMPAVHVIAAGSLLEVKMKKEGFSFPVGRVEYCYMYPVTFDEFLLASGNRELLEYLDNLHANTVIPEEVHQVSLKKFHEYMIVGGMPEAVSAYIKTKTYIDVDPVYESILTGFKDDVHKYSGFAKSKYLQFIIEHAPEYAGLPIKYEKFGGSSFHSREMSEAFDVMEKAMIISRVHASYSKEIPILNNMKKLPKLIYLDIGLINYKLGVRKEIINVPDINAVFHGQLSEQIVGQTLQTFSVNKNENLSYWYRLNKGSISEVDFLMNINNTLVPIEVKSGKTGTLKSLHNFIDESNNSFAVRIYSGHLVQEKIKTPKQKKYTLFSVPFYLLYRLELFHGEML